MKFFQLTLLCFLSLAKIYGQTGTRIYTTVVVEITKEKKPKKISAKAAITTPFPNGDSSWIQSLEDSLNRTIPFKNGAKVGQYIVSVKFLIERDGSMSDIQCLTDPGYGMCEQVVAAITKKFARWPKWAPGEVRQYHTSPVTPQNNH